MEKLIFDTGVKEYEVNGKELLRFNPTDPNVYRRFMEVYSQLESMEKEYEARVEPLRNAVDDSEVKRGEKLLSIMKEFDSKVKGRLSYIFGEENDFEKIMEGVNLMAVGANGERVLTNLFTALTPIIEEGIAQHDQEKVEKAVLQANANRSQRRGRR